jgi:hypothetical protein
MDPFDITLRLHEERLKHEEQIGDLFRFIESRLGSKVGRDARCRGNNIFSVYSCNSTLNRKTLYHFFDGMQDLFYDILLMARKIVDKRSLKLLFNHLYSNLNLNEVKFSIFRRGDLSWVLPKNFYGPEECVVKRLKFLEDPLRKKALDPSNSEPIQSMEYYKEKDLLEKIIINKTKIEYKVMSLGVYNDETISYEAGAPLEVKNGYEPAMGIHVQKINKVKFDFVKEMEIECKLRHSWSYNTNSKKKSGEQDTSVTASIIPLMICMVYAKLNNLIEQRIIETGELKGKRVTFEYPIA